MQVLNFSHPMLSEQLAALADIMEGVTIGRVVDVKVQLNQDQPFGPQIAALVEGIGWTPTQWQHNQFVVSLPGLSAAGACILAEIHGRCGYFPAVIRTKPVGGPPPKFEPAEVINLAAVRDIARHTR